MSKFYDEIKNALVERQVEDVYNKEINLYFPTTKGIEYPFACDGFVDTKTDNKKVLKLIIEYKFNEMLNNSVSRAKVLVQVIYYLKRFEQNGLVLPNVCMVGDKDECFVMHTNELLKYLDENVDWSISPSNASINGNNPDLVLKVSQDGNINPFIFNVDKNFNFKIVAEKIKDLANNVQRYVRVTEHNLSKIFDYFCKNVLKGKAKLSGHDLVEIFMGVISDKMNCYQHPSNPNVLVCNGKNVTMDGKSFKSFFGYFDRNYTPQETMRLKGIADRLIEDADRRMKGDFWTPTAFVDYAHNMIEDVIGDDWKESCVVWDNCWGTGNLTRDYMFKELYCSTLYQGELNIGAEYNQEATKFQFDFLNDDIPMPDDLVHNPTKLPQGLVDALTQDKPIVFFLNPPYSTSSSDYGKGAANTKGAGVCSSAIYTEMVNNNMGNASKNLYAQFLYRIMKIKQGYNLTNCYIGLYSPTLFLTGPSWSVFRQHFLKEFSFKKACQFQASHFADVSKDWGISFSIWHCGETIDKKNFFYDCVDEIDGEVQVVDTKIVYNMDGDYSAKEWIKIPIKGISIEEKPTLSSALSVQTGKFCRTKINKNALGCYSNMGNSVDQNQLKVSIFTSCDSSNANGLSIMKENFERVIALFSARKLINKNWINSKDEYIAPDENHPQYNEFVNNSIVHSLFHSASNQSSLRNLDYKGKTWNIYNEFFWMSNDEIMQLANNNNFSQTYNEARISKNRYVYDKLQTIILSPEAQVVLDKANEIVRSTFKYREMFDSEHPEYQIMNWDCGWYQIKALAKEYAKNDYDNFVKLFKLLEEKMRPMVYILGFLK